MSPKAERDWRLYADDIIEACGKVRRYVAGMTYDVFAHPPERGPVRRRAPGLEGRTGA